MTAYASSSLLVQVVVHRCFNSLVKVHMDGLHAIRPVGQTLL